MPSFPYTLLDVFTATPLEGNGLAVVHEADELDDELMQRFAIEARLSETTFVQTPTAEGADYRNRIWMMTGELPFAGHPSLGTAVAVARARGEDEATYRQQTLAGVQPVDVRRTGDSWEASMLQEPAEFFDELEAEGALRALGLQPGAAHPELPPQPVSTGLKHLMLPLRSAAELAAVEPDYDALARAARAGSARPDVYPFVLRPAPGAPRPARSRAARRSPRIRPPARPPGRCARTSSSAPASAR